MRQNIVYNVIEKAFKEAEQLLHDFILKQNLDEMQRIVEMLAKGFLEGNKVIIFGNGGSATDAMHFAEEFTGRFRKNRKALPAIAISDSSHITCVGNDFGFDDIFSRGVEAYAKPGDIVIGLSTSGNSANIEKGLKVAKELGAVTVTLLGKDGGRLKGECDYELIVQGITSDRIQEIHMMILHIIIEGVERILFPENY
ncbi:MAG: SIS domain-containing protein [Candidatus Cloacimonetes bacterium]|nr:SIS domain-containing protein [Candidatus Cloacimonadota bacterium]